MFAQRDSVHSDREEIKEEAKGPGEAKDGPFDKAQPSPIKAGE